MRIYTMLFSLIISTLAAAANLSNIVVFGDSLSDMGNLYKSTNQQLPSSPPYFEGRFSNGPVWIEQLLTLQFPEREKLPLENYAFGGAVAAGDESSMNLGMEITMYLNGHDQKADPKNLYIIWIGSNDYLKAENVSQDTVKQVNQQIKNGMNQLIKKGARYFLVLNLPDIGKSPKARAALAMEKFSNITERHNKKLAKVVSSMNKKVDVMALYVDVNAEFSRLMEQPEQAGFENVVDNCLEQNSEDRTSCENWFFFDSLHPTTKTHGLIAETVGHVLGEARLHVGK